MLTATGRLVVALATCAALAGAVAPASAATLPPSVSPVIHSGRPFTISGLQQPSPPYSSAGTLAFEHYEKGAWRAGGTESVFSDALPFLVRPSVGSGMNLVSAVPTGGPQENRLVVSASVPNSGIGLTGSPSQPVSVEVSDGAVYGQSSKADGTSIAFAGSLFQAPFASSGLEMTAISAPVEMRSPSGVLLQVFGASHYMESVASGNLYLRRDGGPPSLLMSEPGKRVELAAPLVPVPGGVLMTYMVQDATGDTAVHVARWDPELQTELSDQTVLAEPGYDYQAYSTIRCADGLIVMPFVYVKTSAVTSAPWTMDVAVSQDDGATWTRLDQPRTFMANAPFQPGIMEPAAVEVAPGQVAILFRCAAGFIGRIDLDLAAMSLGQPYLTDLEAPLAGLSVLKLDSGVIAVAWTGCAPDAKAPKLPRKVVVLGLSEDGLQSFSSVHVVSTSESLGDSMVTATPYVHQPKISEIDGTLRVGVDRVVTGSDIIPYIYVQRGPLLVRNVIVADGQWHSVAMDPSAQRLDLLAAFGPAGFQAVDMIGPQTTWSATTTLPTGGRWRVRLVGMSGASTWTTFMVDRAILTRPALSHTTVTFARPALLTARLLSATDVPLGSRPVQLLCNGRLVKTIATRSDGTVQASVGSKAVARWTFRFAGNDTTAGVTSTAVQTIPKLALRLTVPASGLGKATCYLSRGSTFAVVAGGRFRGALLKGPSHKLTPGVLVRVTRTTMRFVAPTSGYYSVRVAMPRGGTFIIW